MRVILFKPERRERRCSTRNYRWVANTHKRIELPGLFTRVSVQSTRKGKGGAHGERGREVQVREGMGNS